MANSHRPSNAIFLTHRIFHYYLPLRYQTHIVQCNRKDLLTVSKFFNWGQRCLNYKIRNCKYKTSIQGGSYIVLPERCQCLSVALKNNLFY
jgi:hypothetical protein